MKIYEPVYGGQSGSYREGKVEEDSPPFIHKFTHSSGLKRGSGHIFKILNKMFHTQIHMSKDDSKTRMPNQMFSVHGWNSKSGVAGCGCANGQQRCVKCQLCDLSVEIVAPDTWKWNKETRANYCSLFVSHQLEVFLSQKQVLSSHLLEFNLRNFLLSSQSLLKNVKIWSKSCWWHLQYWDKIPDSVDIRFE